MSKTLTAKDAAAATGKAARYELRDKQVAGLRLVVQPSGVKTWALRYRASGQARRFTIGTYSEALGLAEARTMAAKVKLGVVKGDDPAADRASARVAPVGTVAAAFDLYDAAHLKAGKVGEETAAGTRSFFARRVLPVWGKRPVGSITRQDVVALLDKLDGFKDARRKGKTRLSHFFGWTMDRNATVATNPAAGVQTETPASRERILSDDELRTIWNACDQVGTFGAMVRTLILTMARRGEVSNMPVSELSESLWSIDASRTKNGRPMDIVRTAALNAVLASVPRTVRDGVESPFVFEGRHHNRPLGGFSDLKTKLDAATGDAVAPWTLHDLRRTSTSLLQRLGIAAEVRRACANQSTSDGVGRVYDRHAYAAEKRHAFEALAAEVLRIVEGREVSNVVPMTRPMA